MLNIMDLYRPKKCKVCGCVISDRTRSGLCKKHLNASYWQKRKKDAKKKGTCIRCGGQREGWQKTCSRCRAVRNACSRKERKEDGRES